MNRREALAALVSLPTVASVQVVPPAPIASADVPVEDITPRHTIVVSLPMDHWYSRQEIDALSLAIQQAFVGSRYVILPPGSRSPWHHSSWESVRMDEDAAC